MEFWISESEKIERRKKWKQDFQSIGQDVYSFFMDTAIEKGFENREGQWDMTFEIVDAMKNRQHILVEAGVGIGKTFAYIVPLLYYYKRYKILISEREKSADGTVKQEIKIYYSFHLVGDIAYFPVCIPLRTADR